MKREKLRHLEAFGKLYPDEIEKMKEQVSKFTDKQKDKIVLTYLIEATLNRILSEVKIYEE